MAAKAPNNQSNWILHKTDSWHKAEGGLSSKFLMTCNAGQVFRLLKNTQVDIWTHSHKVVCPAIQRYTNKTIIIKKGFNREFVRSYLLRLDDASLPFYGLCVL